MSTQCHYMKKPDGVIVKVNLNDWARKRKAGWTFSTEKDFNDQAQGATPDKDDDQVVPTMDNTKAEIVDYLIEQGFEVDENLTKAELLEAVAEG